MSSYLYTLSINYPSYLQTQIQGLGLSSSIDHIDTDGSQVTIWFQSSLSVDDQTTLNAFMETYADPTVSAGAIAACISAMNTDANVILVARTRIKATIPALDVLTLLQLCTLLGVNPNL
jgi:hypothetical protein